MKPTRLHYFYAQKWPIWIWIICAPLLCVALMASALSPPASFSPTEPETRSYLFLLAIAALLGWAAGALVGKFVLGPIYFHRAQLNGAPFQPGDRVEILVGPNRGRIVQVLESWHWRGTAKVDLGEGAAPIRKNTFSSKDIFEETQLLKVADAE